MSTITYIMKIKLSNLIIYYMLLYRYKNYSFHLNKRINLQIVRFQQREKL